MKKKNPSMKCSLLVSVTIWLASIVGA
ncbi:hypothetical protein SAMN05216387_1263, partial [Nitrosovibrio tenuis]